MNESLQNLLKPSDPTRKLVVDVVSSFLENGYLPCIGTSTTPSLSISSTGSVSLDILPPDFLTASNDVYQLNLVPGPINLKMLPVGNKLAVHVSCDSDVTSVTLEPESPYQAVNERIRLGLLPFVQRPPAIGRRRRDPTHPEDPLCWLPGHTPEGGDLVGPHNPIFGEPRYDPIGPGNIGEPDYDHQPPGPFGTRPPRRPFFPFQ